MHKKRIESVPVSGKKVFIRVDFNVPMDGGVISDDRRIRASLPTIRSVLSRGGRAVLASHLGRPEGKGFEAEYSLAPVAKRLAELLGADAPHGVAFPSSDCTDDAARAAIAAMPEKGVVLLENLRFVKGEKKGDPAFAEKLATLCDVYVNDAFGTSHRADASMHALPMAMGARGAARVAGHLLAAELEYLYGRIAAAERPFTAILGGAKVSDKILAIENLMMKVDRIIVGGAMAYTFLRAQGVATGNSLVEADRIDLAKEILAKAKSRGCAFLDGARHRSVDARPLRRRDPHEPHRRVERPDGRLRDAALRRRHARGRRCGGRGDGRRCGDDRRWRRHRGRGRGVRCRREAVARLDRRRREPRGPRGEAPRVPRRHRQCLIPLEPMRAAIPTSASCRTRGRRPASS